ncbi:MAG TPA: hypothetical protein VF911_01205, partial [Thermoanaerobaculia bacterium]
MRKRQTNPVILIATVIALAIGAWWNNAERSGTGPEVRPAARDGRAPAAAGESRAAETRAATPQASEAAPEHELATLVPDPRERTQLVQTLERIERGGPFPFKQDGTIFGNR